MRAHDVYKGAMQSLPVTPDTTASVIVSLFAVGMALAFILADRRSQTSQAQASFLAFVGISITIDVMWVLPMRRANGVVFWEGLLALPQVLAFVFAYERPQPSRFASGPPRGCRKLGAARRFLMSVRISFDNGAVPKTWASFETITTF